MSNQFTPITPRIASQKELLATSMRLKVVTGSDAGSFSGRASESGSTALADHDSHLGTEPVVTLQREGDKVVGVRIVCSCGQVTELACVY